MPSMWGHITGKCSADVKQLLAELESSESRGDTLAAENTSLKALLEKAIGNDAAAKAILDDFLLKVKEVVQAVPAAAPRPCTHTTDDQAIKKYIADASEAIKKSVADAMGSASRQTIDPKDIGKYIAEAISADLAEYRAHVGKLAESLGPSIKSAFGDALAARIAYETELTLLKAALSEKETQLAKYEADILEYSRKIHTFETAHTAALTEFNIKTEESRKYAAGLEKKIDAMKKELEKQRTDYERFYLEAENYKGTIDVLQKQIEGLKTVAAEPSKKSKKAKPEEAEQYRDEILENIHMFRNFGKAPEMIYKIYKEGGPKDTAESLRELHAKYPNLQECYHALDKLASGK